MNSTLAVLSADDGHEAPEPGRGAGVFLTTHWSIVLAAKTLTSPEGFAALERLCRTYWYPLYVFVRRQGRSPEDAEDLVQEFFARLLQKEFLQAVEPERGRFRTFLMMALKRMMANEWDRATAQKRGGTERPLPLDPELAEGRYQAGEANEMPCDLAYDRQWAVTLLDQALAKLQDEHKDRGKGAQFQLLRNFLTPG